MAAVIARWLGVRPADASVRHWHVSPAVDLASYAFSWVWVAVPLFFLGNEFRVDYLGTYLLVLAVTDVHRHYNMPYVYMDRDVFRQHKLRFTLFPGAMFVMWLASPWWVRAFPRMSYPVLGALVASVVALVLLLKRDPIDANDNNNRGIRARDIRTSVVVGVVLVAFGFAIDRGALEPLGFAMPTLPTLSTRGVFGVIAVFAGVWNLWHVFNQKYGILRLYNAKREANVSGRVDRWLVWGWLPFLLFYLTREYTDFALQRFSQGSNVLRPLFESFREFSELMIVPTGILVAASIVCFFYSEWRADRFRNAPRWSMGIGTTLLASTFLLMHPAKAYLAYAFSHAIEYMVFVWAFQRRRYNHELAHQPLLGRVLKHPATWYLTFTLGLAAVFLHYKYSGWLVFKSTPMPRAFGFTTAEWIGYWTIYQSMVHFYFDGFLWKMRLSTVRASI